MDAENFVADTLNIMNDWKLVNANKGVANTPCIDLIDRQQRIGVQVSSQRDSKKVNDTIACLERHGINQSIDRLIVFSLLPKQARYKIDKACPNVTFDWRSDIIDFDDTLKQAQDFADLARLRVLHKQITSATPAVFAARRSAINEQVTQLRELMVVFDREVLVAPFRYEDPIFMCQALREIRISLQRMGAGLVANQVAAKSFRDAQQILRQCEYKLRDNFPSIFAAAFTPQFVSQPGVVPYDYNEYGPAIHLMMNIRPELEMLLSDVKQEIARLDSSLT